MQPSPIVSIIQRPDYAYPDGDEFYSPNSAFPEYAFETVASSPNAVYAIVRETLAQAGLDEERFNTPAWNPFGEFVNEGDSVFVLVNFVHHRLPWESRQAFYGKCTHGSVIRAVIDYLLIAVGPAGKIRFGNAPLQSCRWDQVLQDTGADQVLAFYQQRRLPVEACDLRLFVTERDFTGRVTHQDHRDESKAVFIDFGEASLLEVVTPDGAAPFRVSEYNPDRTVSFHQKGKHIYALHHSILESDLILSVPKLKVHQKVGITCGIKGTVGTISYKDCLAHHRLGAPVQGGDEYPRDLIGAMKLQSRFHDYVWRTSPQNLFGNLLRVVDRNIRRLQRWGGWMIAGSWWGNDTAWRMALDIARLVSHADRDGRLHNKSVRPHIVLVDGVIGGEGNGPLRPTPVKSGTVLFSNDLVAGDVACATIMGFDWEKIPLVAQAFSLKLFGLTGFSPVVDNNIYLNGKKIDNFASLALSVNRSFLSPAGWKGHIERAG